MNINLSLPRRWYLLLLAAATLAGWPHYVNWCVTQLQPALLRLEQIEAQGVAYQVRAKQQVESERQQVESERAE